MKQKILSFQLWLVVILTLLFLSSIDLYGEKSTQNIRVALNLKNTTIKEALNKIEQNSSFVFFYSDNVRLELEKKVTLNTKSQASISEVLNAVLHHSNLTYDVRYNQISIVMKKPEKEMASSKDAKEIKVTGYVLDKNKEPLIGVSVAVKGTITGTITDVNGQYSISVPNQNSVLVFSYIGYLTVEETVGSRTQIDVTLQEDDQTLEEVVVVGYGVQKKVNLSGAVQAVSGSEIANRPISNINSGLQGLVPNLNITAGSGRADDAPSLNIRGYTSINGGEAFILVDNVPVSAQELSRLNPDDVENVSVLKDASAAAIYGARAAFGVVLITTKKAKSNKLQINFNGNYALRDRGISPKIVTDVETVMKMKNAARAPLSPVFSQSEIAYAEQLSQNPSLDRVIVNPNNANLWSYFGETNWLEEAFKSSAPTYTANINISKKNEELSYYVSGGYYQQDGLLQYGNDVMKRYNFRANADLKLTKWWTIGTNVSYVNSSYDSPTFLDGYFYWNVNRNSSTNVPKNPDGTWTNSGAAILGSLQNGGRRIDRTNETQISLTTQLDIIKNIWKLNADINFRRSNINRDQSNLVVPYRTGPSQPLQYALTERGGESYNNTSNAFFRAKEYKYDVYNIYTNFTKTFKEKHYLGAMLGYNREISKDFITQTVRKGLITDALPEINLATGETTSTNSRQELALEGVFSRLNYIYDNRYIVEFNGRYDGSSRFPDGDRWGFFPSGSLAWSLINENFFSGAAEKLHITNLKLRGSYGSLGNQNVTNSNGNQLYYPYIPYMSSKKINWILDRQTPLAISQPGVVSASLTWEKVRTINGGIDFGLFNKFDLSFDLYTRYTDDMLTLSKELPGVFGATEPKTNAADLKTNGWELTVAYRDRFQLAGNPFNWSVKFMIADNKSKITKYDNPTYNFGKNGNTLYKGKRIGEIWGFTNDGFFQSEEELAKLDQTEVGTDDQSYKFYVGDTKFKDMDGDNKISFGDNTLKNPGDRKVIGNSEPRYPYSFELSADWKRFDFRAFFQGIGKRDWYPTQASIYFWGIYAQPWTNVTKKNMDHWTEENRNAYFPRVKAYSAEDNDELGTPQTKYLQDASYLRMKNLTIGYTLPKSILKKMNLELLRIYFSAENLFTISNLDKDISLDPEIITKYSGFNSGTYPMQRTYSFGLNLTF